MSPSIDTFAREIAGRLDTHERQIKVLSNKSDLGKSSFENGSVDAYTDGQLALVVGQQYDGSTIAAPVSGPNPPQPTAALATGGITAVIRWDGFFYGDPTIVAPMDFSRVEIHASQDETYTAETAATLRDTFESPRGGEKTISLPVGTWFVRLVTRTVPGNRSAPSAVVSVTVEEPAGGVSPELLEQINQSTEDIEAAQVTLDQVTGATPMTPTLSQSLALGTQSYLRLAVTQLSVGEGNMATGVIDKLFSDVVVAKTSVTATAFIGENAVLTGAITAPKITASQELWAKIGTFATITSGMIVTGALDGKLITGAIIRTAATGARVLMDQTGLTAYDAANTLVTRINGTDNLLSGRLSTNPPGLPGLILIPKTSTGFPGIWFSEDGTTTNLAAAAIYTDSTWNIIIRGKTDGSGFKGALQVDGGVQVSGAIGEKNSSWAIGNTGTAFLKSVDADSAIIGRAGGSGYVHNPGNFAGFFMRHTSGSTPLNTDGAIWVPNQESFMHIRGPIAANGVRQGIILYDFVTYQSPPTSTFAANVGISSNPIDRLYKLTSARKYKYAIEDFPAEDAYKILNVNPRTWFDSHQTDAYASWLENGGSLDDVGTLRRVPGVVAEEVEDAGLSMYCTYDANGEIDGVAYDRLPTLFIPILRDILKRLGVLEGGTLAPAPAPAVAPATSTTTARR